MRRFEKMPTPQGIGAGQTATINLPLGPTYHNFFIRLNVSVAGTPTDVAAADFGNYIDDVRLMVNGDTRIEITAADLVKMNAYYDAPAQPGVLPLYLSQPWARTMAGEDNTAYGTAANMASFTLEMDLKTGIVVNELKVYAKQSAPKAFGSHLRIQRFSDQMALQGTKEVSDLPRGAYNMMALHLTTAAIDDVEVLADNRKIFDTDRVVRRAEQTILGRNPQVDFTHIDFMTENRLSEALPMALNDFRLKLDVTTAGQTWKLYAVSIQGVATAA